MSIEKGSRDACVEVDDDVDGCDEDLGCDEDDYCCDEIKFPACQFEFFLFFALIRYHDSRAGVFG